MGDEYGGNPFVPSLADQENAWERGVPGIIITRRGLRGYVSVMSSIYSRFMEKLIDILEGSSSSWHPRFTSKLSHDVSHFVFGRNMFPIFACLGLSSTVGKTQKETVSVLGPQIAHPTNEINRVVLIKAA